ncbi:MAG: F0F1 ATP synthase subunit B [Rhizobiaceae bacterium]|jgi:F-type H+-transporting ATPase subunit b|nr:F0F1 ATP synthase subunit B [Rhizobiaceae bacterium]
MFVTAALAASETATHGDAAAHGADAAHGGGGVFPPFDPTYFPSQLFWLFLSFGLFYLFMSRVVLPRIGEILETRRDRIAHDIDEAATMKAEADAALAAYEQSLAQARANASDIGSKARDQAKAEAEAERQRVEGELAGRLAGAEKRIGEIKAKALSNLDSIAEDTAGAILGRLYGGKIAKADIAAAVKAARGN